MTIADINSLPELPIYKTGRDYAISSILVINQETKSRETFTDSFTEVGNLVTIDLTLSDLLSEIKDITTLSVIMYSASGIIVYRDIVLFTTGTLGTTEEFTQVETTDEYIFLD